MTAERYSSSAPNGWGRGGFRAQPQPSTPNRIAPAELALIALPAQNCCGRVVAERSGGLYGTPAECLQPGTEVFRITAKESADIGIAQVGPDAVGTQQQHVAQFKRPTD